MEFTPLDEHQLLVFLVQLLLLVGSARLLGAAMKSIGQPPVVGELLAGVLLGPSVLARLVPGAYQWVFPADAVLDGLLFGLAWLGVIMLLVVIGFETDLAIINRFRRAAAFVVGGSLLLPFAAGTLLGFGLPEAFVGEQAGQRAVFALFVATGLSVSALPVVAKILSDLGLMRRNFGQITLAAGMAMDSIGWLLLAALSGIALQGGLHIPQLVTSMSGLVVFVVVAATVGRWALDQAYRRALDRGGGAVAALTITLLAALLGGAVTQALRLEAILGAFVVGILAGTTRHQLPEVREQLESVTAAFFAPIFFAISGLRVDLGALSSGSAVRWTLLVLGVAFLAKLLGTYFGARLGGLERREGWALGTGLAALGAMGIVVAIVGLNIGVLNDASYTVLVLTALVTSVAAPSGLRLVVRNWSVSPEERQRLEREALRSSSMLLGTRRALLPTRGGRNSVYAARLLAAALHEVEVTVLLVDVPDGRRSSNPISTEVGDPFQVVAALGELPHDIMRRTRRDPVSTIASESRLGYDLVVLGASEAEREGALFSSVVDRLLATMDVPSLVVRSPALDEILHHLPHRLLVPATATIGSRAAEEFAYSLVRATGGEVLALHVVNQPQGEGLLMEGARLEEAIRSADEVLASAVELGQRLGVVVDPLVKVAPHAEEEIVALAASGDFDLLVLGTAARPLTNRPFFGHRIQYILDHAPIPVAVLSIPTPSFIPEVGAGVGQRRPHQGG
ncbi:MAG: cation:proton antiporter [Actinomycetota bacterium]|nr:cation:proton antiporter [Actinomycetota bacterium]